MTPTSSGRGGGRRGRNRASSPPRERATQFETRPSKISPSASSSSSSTLVTEEFATAFEDLQLDDLPIAPPKSSDGNPRSFPYSVKQQCWEKAEKVKGRDPERWRKDPLGNILFRKLVGCPGCLCHDYDHIVPYSKGGKSTLDNCQVLQATVNRSKGNRTDISKSELIRRSSYCKVSGRDMDLLELSAYGNVRRGQDSGGCSIQ